MEEKELKAIPASEARAIADNTETLKRRIYKFIKELAYDGEVSMVYCLERVSDVQIEKIINSLKSNGYSVSFNAKEHALEVKW